MSNSFSHSAWSEPTTTAMSADTDPMLRIRSLLFGASENALQQQLAELMAQLQRTEQQLQHAQQAGQQQLAERAEQAEKRLHALEQQLSDQVQDLEAQLQNQAGNLGEKNLEMQKSAQTALGMAQVENRAAQAQLRTDIESLRQDMTQQFAEQEQRTEQALTQLKAQLKAFFQELVRRQDRQAAQLREELQQAVQHLQEEKVNRADLANLFGRMVSRLSNEMLPPSLED